MANYYTEYSFQLPLATPEQRTWWEKRIEHVNSRYEETDSADPDEQGAYEQLVGPTQIDEEGVWFYSDDCDHMEGIILSIQDFMLEFKIPGAFGWTWAATCDKHRLDAFSGGWVVVTAHSSEIGDASAELTRHMEKIGGQAL
jgi:hypothetical protein